MNVTGITWISSGDADDFRAENVGCDVRVARTDDNEVLLGLRLPESEGDDVSVYFTVSEASRLAHLLGVAVMANEAAAHEAASMRAAAGGGSDAG